MLIQSTQVVEKVLVGIINDENIKAYNKIEAIKTLFAVVDKGVIDRQQQEQLTELKEKLAVFEDGRIIYIN